MFVSMRFMGGSLDGEQRSVRMYENGELQQEVRNEGAAELHVLRYDSAVLGLETSYVNPRYELS